VNTQETASGSIRETVYLNNSATSFPKPEAVYRGMDHFFRTYGDSPDRTGPHVALRSASLVDVTRERLCRFFDGPDDPARAVFSYNASDALNTGILGMLTGGGHCVASAAEHNSVLRPLWHLKERGVTTDYVPVGDDGLLDPADVERAIGPQTKLVALNHASNVTGLVQDIASVGAICKEKGVPLLVDASQTTGVLDISMKKLGISLLAYTGHKSMLAPTGIGGLLVMEGVEVMQTRFGGTGFDSASRPHPDEYPWRLEVGSVNLSGVAGLNAALDYLEEHTPAEIHEHEMRLYDMLAAGLGQIEGLTLYHPVPREKKIAVLSLNFEGMHPDEVGARLLSEHSIMVRSGLHCAPLMHEALGSYPDGTVRFSIGALNSTEDIERALNACRALVKP